MTQETKAPVGLGAEYQPLRSPQLDNPYPFYARARREEPVFFNPALGMWFITRHADVVAILKDSARFSSADTLRGDSIPAPEVLEVLREGYPPAPVLLDNDPPAHTRMRRYVQPSFRPQRIQATEPWIRRFATELIDRFAGDGRADLVSAFCMPLPAQVILQMMGVPPEDLERIHKWSADWETLIFSKVPVPQQVECARSIVAFQHYVAGLVAARRTAPREDLTTELVQAGQEEGQPLTTPELVNILSGLLIAGHYTTTNLISSGLYHLLRHPELLSTLRTDPRRIPDFVEEVLRYESPIQGIVRTATEDVEVAGVTIPQGARLFVLYGAANRDPACFTAPDELSLTRADRAQHLGFGRGIHFCAGAELARLEVKLALGMLLERLPGLRLAPGWEPQWMPNLAHRGLESLRVEWDVRG
jgi:cytochrome P450